MKIETDGTPETLRAAAQEVFLAMVEHMAARVKVPAGEVFVLDRQHFEDVPGLIVITGPRGGATRFSDPREVNKFAFIRNGTPDLLSEQAVAIVREYVSVGTAYSDAMGRSHRAIADQRSSETKE